jgi:Protein of unknown function DUF262
MSNAKHLTPLVEQPVDDLDEVNETLPVAFSITAYGADYPVDGLAKRIKQGDIVIPRFSAEPETGQSMVGFQREYVWRKPQADKFIESLLLGLPVPGIFLVKETDGKHLVLDGQQRLHTISSFYEGIFQGKEFKLEFVQARWVDKTYKTLYADDRRRLDDSIIHATIVRQDEPSEDQSSIYLIFERLNSGGTFLQPQEIRVALYHGEFATLLSVLNSNESWRKLYGAKSVRLKDIELILRFLALYYHSASYRRPMKEFLNRYMSANRNLQKQSAKVLTAVFERTVLTISRALGDRAFRPKSVVNAAVLDSIMVGVASALAAKDSISDERLKAAYDTLLSNQKYLEVTQKSTADEENVRQRISLAKEAVLLDFAQRKSSPEVALYATRWLTVIT